MLGIMLTLCVSEIEMKKRISADISDGRILKSSNSEIGIGLKNSTSV